MSESVSREFSMKWRGPKVLTALAGLIWLTLPGLACAAAPSEDAAASSRAAPTRRALVVAIGHYAAETEWHDLNTASDLAFVKTALEGQGFSTIDELTDERATRVGIEQAFRSVLLERANPGDVVVFHYSGHGQQITDDDGDELDGYDETIVAHDAPKRLVGNYGGERHLRDDDFNDWMTALRARVGPSGQVIAFLDSCVSGTPRGEAPLRGEETDRGAELQARGGLPLGPRRPGASARGDGSEGGGDGGNGGFLEGPRGATRHAQADDQLAPYVVISAARHDELAWETLGEDGKPIGALSWALGLELAKASPATRYRDLFERIEERMARRVSNEPQLEGLPDRKLWVGGAVEQEPFFAVRAATLRSPGRTASPTIQEVELAAGTLAGVLVGSEVEIHRAGVAKPTPESLLASGTVATSAPTFATVTLDRGITESDLMRARAFLTQQSFGALSLRIKVHNLPAPLAAALRQRVARSIASVEWVASSADVEIRGVRGAKSEDPSETREKVEIHATNSRGTSILPPFSLVAGSVEGDSALDDLVAALVDNLRSRYLRQLDVRDPAFDVRLELKALDPSAKPWQVGQRFELWVENRSDRSAYINVLDLTADGAIQSYWPGPRTVDKTEIPPRTPPRKLAASYEMTEPLGSETILLVASTEPIDFRPILSREGVWGLGKARGALGPFAPLYELESARGAMRFEPGKVATWSITGRVVAKLGVR